MDIEYVQRRAKILFGKWYEANVLSSVSVSDDSNDDADIDEPEAVYNDSLILPEYIISLQHKATLSLEAA